MNTENRKTVLGLDLGANSLGWALLAFDGDTPCGLIDMGVRVFEAGTEGQIESGRDESRGVERRQARQRRRQTKRQSMRMVRLAKTLQRYGLLPPGDVQSGKTRHNLFEELDKDLRREYAERGIPVDASTGLREFPYFLRARALDEALPPHALGRALYHLAQRRGFLSNRKSDKDEKELGVVKSGISELQKAIIASGARTLGEYFFRLDPVLEKRIRSRWTARGMYRHEFDQIMEAQERLGGFKLPDGARKTIADCIFYQRPLKSQKGLVGECDLEPKKKRAPRALLCAQRFRLLQKVNDMCVIFPDGRSRPLNDDEKQRLAAHLDTVRETTFGKLRKELGLPRNSEFNLEQGGENKLKGNTTAAPLREVFGERWDALGRDKQNAIVGELMGIEKEEALLRRGKFWGLSDAEAEKFAKIKLEEGYISLSREAINKLLPLMEQGISFKTAEKQVYGAAQWSKLLCDKLPPVADAVPAVRNPVVMRCLTELRKVVNAIIRKYGKPDEIHLELARDLKKSRDQRKRIWEDNRKREQQRDEARKRIERELGLTKISRDDIEKVLLAEECNWTCPYTGKSISMSSLLGEHPQFDIEHIIPFSRCLDDSFMNKTLCHHEENRTRKGNRTPWEAYGNTPEWEAIIERVKRFNRPRISMPAKGRRGAQRDEDKANPKLMRFQIRDIKEFEEFTTQKLNDTRYASKLAARYLAWLYGDAARSRIQTSAGQITALLRDAWHLNKILGDPERNQKSREDHRHHAIDALVIAMTNRAVVKRLSDSARQQQMERGRVRGFIRRMEIPWQNFLQDVTDAVERIVVSHRVSHRLNGCLHEDTIYSPPRQDENGKTCHVVRKPLNEKFKAADVDTIVDPAVRDAVRRHLEAHGGKSEDAFADPANHPRLPSKSGAPTPIHRVRVRRIISPFIVGKDENIRYVTTSTNHHLEILETTTAQGKPKWEGVVVSTFEANIRKKQGRPIIQKDHGPQKKFLFSLASNDSVIMKNENGAEQFCVIRGVSIFSTGKIEVDLVSNLDARPISKIERQGRTRTPDTLRQSGCRKVWISPLGEVYPAND